jgi:glycolate oxidase FAD binding subunit
MTIAANLAARLEGVVGSSRVLASEAELLGYAIEDCLPAAAVRPSCSEEVCEVVRFAAAEKLGVVCCGSRSKLQMGMQAQRYDVALDLCALAQIAHYDEADLTLSVDAGMRLEALSKVLAAKRQFVPLAVPCLATSTVGGSVVSGIDSMLRLQYGTARDFLVGAEFVDGTGRTCKSGGRVVKNVTGYDIHKLLIGSLGTLAAITRLNFRTFPLPETSAGALTGFSSAEAALAFRRELLGSGLPFSCVELFDGQFSSLLDGELGRLKDLGFAPLKAGGWSLYTAFAGEEAVVRRMKSEVENRSARAAAKSFEMLEEQRNEWLGDALRESFDWLRHAARGVVIVRISQKQFATQGPKLFLSNPSSSGWRSALLMSGSGTVMLALLPEEENESGREEMLCSVREILAQGNTGENTAKLLHAPAWVKAHCNVWGDLRGDFLLMQRVKAAFDPARVFSPGRFVGGI